MADESFVYREYKGREITLPLTDEMRKFLTQRSKDQLIKECDAVWANLMNKPDEEEDTDEDEEEFVSYNDLKKPELIAEVGDRNEGREEDDKIVIPSSANKADIIALLEADDEAHPDEDEDSDEAPPVE